MSFYTSCIFWSRTGPLPPDETHEVITHLANEASATTCEVSAEFKGPASSVRSYEEHSQLCSVILPSPAG